MGAVPVFVRGGVPVVERDPTFFAPAVVSGREDMEDFEGPLTLLIHLISKNKVAIADIQIGDICDQYIAHLDQMKEMDLEVASAFVQMASHLVYIKARSLLAADQEIPELEQLIQSMEDLQARAQYAQIRAAVEELAAQYIPGGGYMEKPPEDLDPESRYRHQHEMIDLLEALGRMIQRDHDLPVIEGQRFVMPTPIIYSVTVKAEEIVRRLRQIGSMPVGELFGDAESRSEVVATFVAVLELCKLGSIAFVGEGAEMNVRFTGVELDTEALEADMAGEWEEPSSG